MYIYCTLYRDYSLNGEQVESGDGSSAACYKFVACSLDAANQRSQTQQLFDSPPFKENLISCPWISKLYINSTLPFFHLYS